MFVLPFWDMNLWDGQQYGFLPKIFCENYVFIY